MTLEKDNATSRSETPTTLASESELEEDALALSSEGEDNGSYFEPFDHHFNDDTNCISDNPNSHDPARSAVKTPIDPPEMIVHGGAGSGERMTFQSYSTQHHTGKLEKSNLSINTNRKHRDKRTKSVSSGSTTNNNKSLASISMQLATSGWWQSCSKYTLPAAMALFALTILIFSIALMKFTLDEKQQIDNELRQIKMAFQEEQVQNHKHKIEINNLSRQLETEKSRVVNSLVDIHHFKTLLQMMEQIKKKESQQHFLDNDKMSPGEYRTHDDGTNTADDSDGESSHTFVIGAGNDEDMSSADTGDDFSEATMFPENNETPHADDETTAHDYEESETMFQSAKRHAKDAAWYTTTTVVVGGLGLLVTAKNAARNFHNHTTNERTILVVLAPYLLPFR